MKRCWFGLGLLIFLLGLGFLTTLYMDRCHSRTAQLLSEAGAQAQQENWEQAVQLSSEARKQWHESWCVTAAFADHEPMEQIDAQFVQLEVYAGAGEKLSFSALCAQLSSALKAMSDAHGLTWWNLV